MGGVENQGSLIASMRLAVDAAPDDIPLRLHLAELLLEQGDREGAVRQAAAALAVEPTSVDALAMLGRATTGARPEDSSPQVPNPAPSPGPVPTGAQDSFDWQQAEAQLSGAVAPMFVGEDTAAGADDPPTDVFDVEPTRLCLADVGGMEEVKARLEAAFLAPVRNPELRKVYGKSLRGGLLLYGPPGCGKTFIARAVAGELGASFLSVSVADVIDMYIGQSERNIHELFRTAERHAPCVLFLDEVDALGQKRSQLRHSGIRNSVNQLLTELDGIAASREGVFILAATNHPWDVDSALRRPGRLDRTLLVLPPDEPARQSILRYHLRDRPVAGIDLGRLAKQTSGYSGADLAHVCESAAERALMDSARSGQIRMIGQADMQAALADVKASTGLWFETARNVALFANEGGQYDDLVAYMKRHRLL